MLVLSVIAVLHTDSLMCLTENINYTTDGDSKLSCVPQLRCAGCSLQTDTKQCIQGEAPGGGEKVRVCELHVLPSLGC